MKNKKNKDFDIAKTGIDELSDLISWIKLNINQYLINTFYIFGYGKRNKIIIWELQEIK